MFRIEADMKTGEIKQVPLTSVEIADAQERTRIEKEAADNKPDKKKELLDEIDGARTIADLKVVLKELL